MSDRERVLIVEDDPATLNLIALILSEAGFEVCVAQDGVAALDVAAAEHPSVILVGQHLPVMDGPEFVDAYHRLPDGRARVIAMTVGQFDARAGVDAVLEKPFDVEDLVDVVSLSRE